MTEEKNSLLGYLLCAPEQDKNTFCREMDDNREVKEYTFEQLIISSSNLGQTIKESSQSGQYIPIFLDTSFDFLRAFFGILASKKVCVPIHTNAHEDAIAHILKKTHAKTIIVTQLWLYRKLASIQYVREHIHTIFCSPQILAERSLPCQHINVYEIFNKSLSLADARRQLEEVVAQTKPEDPMQIIFTSGTTGEPKGAVLSHKNVIACIVRAGNFLKIDSTYRTLTFLPLSHVMAQNEVFIAMIKRAIVQIVGRDNLLHGLQTFKPNILVSVPRVYQAIHSGIQRKLRTKNLVRKLLNFSIKAHVISKQGPIWQRILASLYMYTIGKLITAKIRKSLGSFKLLATAGAACPEFIYEFFEAIGMPLTNAQGLSEVSGAVIYNEPGKTYRSSIGFPLPGVEVKIDDDGEILMKGDPVFKGYLDEPELNKSSFTPDGWFRTGDLGKIEKVNGKNYIFLLGRKKEIVVLSSGLNIPPVQIEEKLLQHDIIHQAMVVGDGKPRLGALIVPQDGCYHHPNLREEISKIIRKVNMEVDASEKIDNFEILPEPFTIENGMLTPTLKIRRLAVSQRYKDVIGQLYQSSAC